MRCGCVPIIEGKRGWVMPTAVLSVHNETILGTAIHQPNAVCFDPISAMADVSVPNMAVTYM